MSQLSNILIDIDMIIECRDARLPLTSINPRLEDAVVKAWGPDWQNPDKAGPREMGRNRQRLVVYTKRDLAEQRFEEVRPTSRSGIPEVERALTRSYVFVRSR